MKKRWMIALQISALPTSPWAIICFVFSRSVMSDVITLQSGLSSAQPQHRLCSKFANSDVTRSLGDIKREMNVCCSCCRKETTLALERNLCVMTTLQNNFM